MFRSPAIFWKRFAAWGLDALPFAALLIVVFPPFPVYDTTIVDVYNTIPHQYSETFSEYIQSIVQRLWFIFVLYSLYHIVLEATLSTTLGKFAVGIKVIYPNDTPTFLIAIMRYLSCILSWVCLNIGHAFILRHPQQKSLHDLITQTSVVESDESLGTTYLSEQDHFVWSVVGCCSAFIVLLAGCLTPIWLVLQTVKAIGYL